MARVWYVGTYPYREITPNDWDRIGLFGPHYQWSADNGWSVDQDEFRPELLAVLSLDPEFMLNQTGVRPDTPTPPDDVTRPYKIDASILKLVDDAFEALDMAEAALEDIQTSVSAANTSATQAGTFRNEAQTFRNQAEAFKNTAGTSASTATTQAATATTKAGEASVSAAAAKTSETNAEESENNAALSATAADISETNAALSASKAQDHVDEFGLSFTSTTLPPGSNATVTVAGDGPEYSVALGVPQGNKGDKGDTGDVSTATLNTALAGKADLIGGAVPTSQLPAIALTKPFPVANRAAMLALAAQEGDVAVITAGADKGTYMLGSGASTAFASWVQLTTSSEAPVQSVNGQVGTVNLGAADVGASPVGHTHTKAQVGLANVDNTSDENKPVSGPMQTALGLKENKAWQGTRAQFDALTAQDPDRSYFIEE